ncbi:MULTISPECIES: phenylacetic acid degradation protein PaaY [unclassified Duganella]|uniref:phenylacetic acid degradation protein PaaY n=1 Tax=unclassified Duganella TaxID=2636909 RepID=UPI000E34E48C|nr:MULTISPECIES: phenylacetic acid degradation protein PaaY [unclassified Duganella]RFP12121.1 phenylacetic acid degradation protein PaaY [Duganella sp. BJB475]RFP29867.1 phenylacetic acid degradation protein PaaY [Duganella sp. BJB476]
MVKVYEINGVTPVVHPTAYVHPSAVLIGDVIVGPRCYVGPLAALRGDFGRLILEEGANLQDTCVMHGFPGADTVVERDGHIGHGAVLHGCRIGRNALVGMNSVVMDNAVIGADSIVAAMSFVRAGMQVPPRSLVVGTPAKVARELRDDEIKWKTEGTGQYQELAVRSMNTMREVEALTEVEPDRKRVEWESSLPLHLHKNAQA